MWMDAAAQCQLQAWVVACWPGWENCWIDCHTCCLHQAMSLQAPGLAAEDGAPTAPSCGCARLHGLPVWAPLKRPCPLPPGPATPTHGPDIHEYTTGPWPWPPAAAAALCSGTSRQHAFSISPANRGVVTARALQRHHSPQGPRKTFALLAVAQRAYAIPRYRASRRGGWRHRNRELRQCGSWELKCAIGTAAEASVCMHELAPRPYTQLSCLQGLMEYGIKRNMYLARVPSSTCSARGS